MFNVIIYQIKTQGPDSYDIYMDYPVFSTATFHHWELLSLRL